MAIVLYLLLSIFTENLASTKDLRTKADNNISEIEKCVGESVEMDFGKPHEVDPNSVTTISFKKYNGNDPEEIAAVYNYSEVNYKIHQQERTKVYTNGTMRINSLMPSDSGIYTREIKNGERLDGKTKLTVLRPPPDLPVITNISSDDGSVHLKCNSPSYIGNSQIVFKDDSGRRIGKLNVTVKAKMYQCCIEGDIVSKCWPKNKTKCVIYRLPNNSHNSVADNKCKSPMTCIGKTFAFWVSGWMIILIFTVAGSCKECKRRRYLNDHKKGISGLKGLTKLCSENACILISTGVCSVTICFSVGLTVCIEVKDCQNIFYQMMIGVISSWSSLLVFCLTLKVKSSLDSRFGTMYRKGETPEEEEKITAIRHKEKDGVEEEETITEIRQKEQDEVKVSPMSEGIEKIGSEVTKAILKYSNSISTMTEKQVDRVIDKMNQTEGLLSELKSEIKNQQKQMIQNPLYIKQNNGRNVQAVGPGESTESTSEKGSSPRPKRHRNRKTV